MANDEAHLFWRDLGCSDNQIAFIFTIIIVGYNDHFAIFKCANGFGYPFHIGHVVPVLVVVIRYSVLVISVFSDH